MTILTGTAFPFGPNSMDASCFFDGWSASLRKARLSLRNMDTPDILRQHIETLTSCITDYRQLEADGLFVIYDEECGHCCDAYDKRRYYSKLYTARTYRMVARLTQRIA